MIDAMGFYFLFWNSYLVFMPEWGCSTVAAKMKSFYLYRWYYKVLMCIIKLSLDQRAKNKFPWYTQCWRGKFFLHSFNYIAVDHTIPSYLYVHTSCLRLLTAYIIYSSLTSWIIVRCPVVGSMFFGLQFEYRGLNESAWKPNNLRGHRQCTHIMHRSSHRSTCHR